MAPLLPHVASATSRGSDGQSLARLALTGSVLLALAGASYGLSFIELGAYALPLSLAIASGKGLVVLLAFMEFGKLPNSAKLAAGAALVMVLLLLGMMVADVATRERALSPQPPTVDPNVAQVSGSPVREVAY